MGESLNRLTWEIRALVIISLFLQIFLFALAGLRKRVVPIRMSKSTSISLKAPLSIILHWFLWIFYLSADFVATAALGYLSQYVHHNYGGSSQQNQTKHLIMFWTPFLLLHLGSQDTITALSIEDNELWMRHLLILIWQVGFSIYVYCRSNPREGGLWPAAIPMFIAGTVKYAERTWSLQRASMSGLWSSIVNVPDPRPNHAKLMEEYVSYLDNGFPADVIVEPQKRRFVADQEEQTTGNPRPNHAKLMEEYVSYLDNGDVGADSVLCRAYEFFQMFRGLLVDLILSLEYWEESQKYFKTLASKHAYKIIEIEHSLMYEMLHSKAALLHSSCGCAFRAVTLVCTLAALLIFAMHKKSGFRQIEIDVTYVLLGGAVVLEVVSILFALVSNWTLAVMMKSVSCKKFGKDLFLLVNRLWPRSPWSNRMSQYNLISFSALDKPCLWSKIIKHVGLKKMWDDYRYTTYVHTEDKIKDLVFMELRKKREMQIAVNDHRGQWALVRHGYHMFCWSVDDEFEKSILIWHVATDLLFQRKEHSEFDSEIGQNISNYMLFLLIMRPFMLPAGSGKIRFQGTCAEARNFFRTKSCLGEDGPKPREHILRIYTGYDPRHTRNSGSMSVLFDGCLLAHQLAKEFENNGAAMWKLINAVWVEMLCFAANECSGLSHAKQMSKGGEFLTMVWMLMAHLGLGDQCKVEASLYSVKLVVGK